MKLQTSNARMLIVTVWRGKEVWQATQKCKRVNNRQNLNCISAWVYTYIFVCNVNGRAKKRKIADKEMKSAKGVCCMQTQIEGLSLYSKNFLSEIWGRGNRIDGKHTIPCCLYIGFTDEKFVRSQNKPIAIVSHQNKRRKVLLPIRFSYKLSR